MTMMYSQSVANDMHALKWTCTCATPRCRTSRSSLGTTVSTDPATVSRSSGIASVNRRRRSACWLGSRATDHSTLRSDRSRVRASAPRQIRSRMSCSVSSDAPPQRRRRYSSSAANSAREDRSTGYSLRLGITGEFGFLAFALFCS